MLKVRKFYGNFNKKTSKNYSLIETSKQRIRTLTYAINVNVSVHSQTHNIFERCHSYDKMCFHDRKCIEQKKENEALKHRVHLYRLLCRT